MVFIGNTFRWMAWKFIQYEQYIFFIIKQIQTNIRAFAHLVVRLGVAKLCYVVIPQSCLSEPAITNSSSKMFLHWKQFATSVAGEEIPVYFYVTVFQHVKCHLVIIKIINLEIDADTLALICFYKNIQHNGSELISLTGNETQKGQVTVCVCVCL